MVEHRRDPDQRPSPEALLEAARREERRSGRLKIFVGAAPGVGKTYEMLQQARARKQDGYDIVVGVVETHGRKETQALLDGLEIVPRKRLDYKGQWLEEMDLDAIIARRPQIALVDELAHATRPAVVIPSATSTSRNCSIAASMSTRRSMSSISRASTTSLPRSRMSVCARPCPTRYSTAPTPSSSST